MLLKSLEIKFSVIPSSVDEKSVKAAGPVSYVKRLASLKAESVAKGLKEGVVIGADTVVVDRNKILGKPEDAKHAFMMLKRLSGKTHRVVTGLCVIDKYTGKRKIVAVSTEVHFKRLNDKIIDWYIGTGEPMDKAGSYAIQGKGAVLIEGIDGDYNNVVGLPLFILSKILREMGVLNNKR